MTVKINGEPVDPLVDLLADAENCTVESGCMKLGMMPLTPGAIGAAGERIVRGLAVIGDKAAILVNGRLRIPDGLLPNLITEIKDVGRLSNTQQLRDYAAFAARNPGTTFDLWVRKGAELSGPLKAAWRAGIINVRSFPWP